MPLGTPSWPCGSLGVLWRELAQPTGISFTGDYPHFLPGTETADVGVTLSCAPELGAGTISWSPRAPERVRAVCAGSGVPLLASLGLAQQFPPQNHSGKFHFLWPRSFIWVENLTPPSSNLFEVTGATASPPQGTLAFIALLWLSECVGSVKRAGLPSAVAHTPAHQKQMHGLPKCSWVHTLACWAISCTRCVVLDQSVAPLAH